MTEKNLIISTTSLPEILKGSKKNVEGACVNYSQAMKELQREL